MVEMVDTYRHLWNSTDTKMGSVNHTAGKGTPLPKESRQATHGCLSVRKCDLNDLTPNILTCKCVEIWSKGASNHKPES